MEPMTLGSPTHSPTGSPNTSYLPPFLMGEFNQPTTPRTNSLSPTKGRNLAFGSSPPIRPSSQQMPQYNTPLRQKTNPNVSFSNKINGPPTQGLFDTLHQPDWNSPSIQSPAAPITSPLHHSSFTQQHQENLYTHNESPYLNNKSLSQTQQGYPNQSFGFNQSTAAQTSVMSNNDSLCYNSPTMDLNANKFGEDSNEYWVTVFGFPPSAACMVLAQFSNCGNIIDKKFPTQGNWVWIRFGSRSEAGRALALNGRTFPGNLMVGVLPCSHPPQTNRGARQLASGMSRLQNTSAMSPPSAASAGAQRSSGPLSRALEYVFGW